MIGWLGALLLVTRLPFLLLRSRAAFVVATGLLIAMPFGPFFYLRAVVGDLSVPMIVLLATPRVRDRGALLAFGAVAGVLALNTYALGFTPWLACGLLVVTACLWFAGRRVAATVLMAAAFAHTLRLGESTNLWDYVVDPWFATWGVAFWVARLVRRRPATDPAS